MITQRRNIGGLVGGSILIGLGVLFLLAQFFNFMAWQFLWPFIVIGAGGLFFVGMLAGGKSAAGLAIPGAIISVIGLMLLYQNLTGHWASWSYGWTIILVAVGLGILIMGAWTGNAQQRQSGLRVVGIGVVMFVIFGAFFEFLLSGFGGSALRQVFFPVLLILLGLYLVIRRTGLWPGQPTLPPAPPGADSSSTPPSEPPPA
ncbi:MAG: hypothetical protein HW378_4409 [Anaerolineales bacterium]|nr:hypothetical protein [Anaerolineales bacterium]